MNEKNRIKKIEKLKILKKQYKNLNNKKIIEKIIKPMFDSFIPIILLTLEQKRGLLEEISISQLQRTFRNLFLKAYTL